MKCLPQAGEWFQFDIWQGSHNSTPAASVEAFQSAQRCKAKKIVSLASWCGLWVKEDEWGTSHRWKATKMIHYDLKATGRKLKTLWCKTVLSFTPRMCEGFSTASVNKCEQFRLITAKIESQSSYESFPMVYLSPKTALQIEICYSVLTGNWRVMGEILWNHT